MTVIGVLGAGQLGRMLALAGYPLGLRFEFFDENAEDTDFEQGENGNHRLPGQ